MRFTNESFSIVRVGASSPMTNLFEAVQKLTKNLKKNNPNSIKNYLLVLGVGKPAVP